MRILVTDGDARAALAVVRSLGGRGHHVIVGERRRPCLASMSRRCAESFRYPSPTEGAAAFLGAIEEKARSGAVDLVLPVSEVSTLLVVGDRARFGRCRVPFADFAALDLACDKRRVIALAQELGVPVPGTTVVESAALPGDLAGRLRFPVVVKPHRSRVRVGDRWRSTEVTYAQDAADLVGQLARKPAEDFPVLLQEKIRGPGIGVFLLYREGEPVAVFAHRRLREKPPSGGVSVLRESIAVPPDMLDCAERMLRRLRWHGIAMVEFKRDERDGLPKLMEINARFWGSLQLAIDAGVDFPALLAAVACAQPTPGAVPYREGVRTRWLWGDVDSLLLALRERQRPPGENGGGRWAHLRGFLRAGRDVRYEVESLRDPGPGVYETLRWVGGLLGGGRAVTAAWEFVFWVSAAGVLYAYVGYAFVLLVLARFGRARTAAGGEAPGGATQPTVSMLIPMHNEAACIADKLENTLAMDYPREKLEVVVVSDGSTDGSAEIVRSFALRGVRLAELERRGGKAAALNRGLDLALHEIVVFSDASIQLAADALREIVLPFADPSVGCVSGEDRIPGTSGEGFYGRYELLLRRLESEVGSIVGASGCFYAQRRSLCEPFPPGLAPDFLSVLNVVERGYRAVSRPQAIGYMRSLGSTAGEFQRKARTLVRGMTALLAKRALLNPVRFGTFSLELLSHKLMRWLVPVFLLGALVSNAMLWDVPPYRPVLWLQAAFYALALLGVVGGAWARERLWCRIPLYFTIANAAILVAWVRFLRGERQELWAPSRRA